MEQFVPGFSGVRVTRSLVLCVCFVDRCLASCSFLLAIVLSVLLRFTDSDYPFGIFKLFLQFVENILLRNVILLLLLCAPYLVIAIQQLSP